MPIVTNTGPLIILAKLDHLKLLEKMFVTVYIPPAVHREFLAKSGVEASRLDEALKQFIEVTSKPDLSSTVRAATEHLEAGEQQAIALAAARNSTLVIDERLGRKAARGLGLTITGSVGILLMAKKMGHISAVVPLLESARQQGYWLSDKLIDVAADLADEK
jgi:predicted nucleic acid-binding protein